MLADRGIERLFGRLSLGVGLVNGGGFFFKAIAMDWGGLMRVLRGGNVRWTDLGCLHEVSCKKTAQ